jgi:hypothetical protein
VVNLVDPVKTPLGERNLRVDYEHCRPVEQPDIQVNISYIEIAVSHKNTRDLFSKLPEFILKMSDILKDGCNEMLIHAEHFSFPNLIHVLNAFKTFDIKKTLILQTQQEIKNFESEYNLAKLYVNPYLYPYREIDQFSNRLTCQPWFRFFLNTAFDCAKGRLLQYSGTCYVNSVINIILLSPILKLFVIKAMNDYAEYNSRVIPEITRTLEDTKACPLVSETTTTLRTVFILRAVYSILCKKIKPKLGRDLILEASKKYFSSQTTHFFRPSMKKAGEKGFELFVLYSFLYDIGMHFALTDPYIGRGNYYLPRSLKESEIQLVRKGNMEIFSDFVKVSITDPKFDILVVLFPDLELDFYDEITGYLPECATLNIKFSTFSHSICGIRCENTYKIFDSNNYFIDLDWRFLFINKNYIELKAQLQDNYRETVLSISFEFCIYVNKKNGLEIQSENVTCAI